MAITRYSSFNRTVQTIAERDAIENLVDHMVVIVTDAIDDPAAGEGKATYRWDPSDSSWVLISKSNYNTTYFETEELNITDGTVTLSNYPMNNQLWNIQIIQDSLIYAELRIEDLEIVDNTITGLSEFNGKSIRLTYAYGTVLQQLSAMTGGMDFTGTELGKLFLLIQHLVIILVSR